MTFGSRLSHGLGGPKDLRYALLVTGDIPVGFWGEIVTFAGMGYLAQSFDLINVRDLDLISQASEHCSRLVVGVYTDELSAELYGRRPVVPLTERVALVGHIRGVDQVVIHGDQEFELDEDAIVFAVDGQLVMTAETTVELVSRRSSESTILRQALESADQGEAVA